MNFRPLLPLLSVVPSVVVSVVLLPGCLTSSEGARMRQDIFRIKTRMLQMEGTVESGTKESKHAGTEANRRIATSTQEIERIGQNIRTLEGDVDALKAGFRTGALPGAKSDEESIAKTLEKISERLVALEEAQGKMLATLEDSGKKGKKGKAADVAKADLEAGKAASGKKGLSSIEDVRKAFKEKKYKQIGSDEGLQFVDTQKGKVQAEARYYYAESLFKLGQLSNAALAYNEVLKEKAMQSHFSEIQLRLGDCFRRIGDFDVASVYYNELLEKYPKSPEVAQAKEHLESIRLKVAKKAP